MTDERIPGNPHAGPEQSAKDREFYLTTPDGQRFRIDPIPDSQAEQLLAQAGIARRQRRRHAERIGTALITLATRRYPRHARDDRHREFTSELHHILTDSETPRARATLDALLYAADHLRAALATRPRAIKTPAPSSRGASTSTELSSLLTSLIVFTSVLSILAAVTPNHGAGHLIGAAISWVFAAAGVLTSGLILQRAAIRLLGHRTRDPR
jgi:hypothetical protein